MRTEPIIERRSVIPEPTTDEQLEEFLEIRKPGAHLEEGVVADEFVLMLGVDLQNYPKFPASRRRHHVSPEGVGHAPAARRRFRGRTRRLQRPLSGGSSSHRFSIEALATKLVPWSELYMQLCVDGWADEVPSVTAPRPWLRLSGPVWNDQIAPELGRMKSEFLPDRWSTKIRTSRSHRSAVRPLGSSIRVCFRRDRTWVS